MQSSSAVILACISVSERIPCLEISFGLSLGRVRMSITTEPAQKTLINYRVDAGVCILEINDPPANTYTYEMNRQLDEAILRARMDKDVHVMVLTGVGEKFFSAGANINMLTSVDPVYKYYFCLHANETLLRLENTPKLVIAAINGNS